MLIRRISRFVTVGFFATLLHIGISALFLYLTELNFQWVNAIAFVSAFSFSVFFHANWTFVESRPDSSGGNNYMVMALSSFSSYVLSSMLIFFVEKFMGGEKFLVICCMLIGVSLSFIMMNLLISKGFLGRSDC